MPLLYTHFTFKGFIPLRDALMCFSAVEWCLLTSLISMREGLKMHLSISEKKSSILPVLPSLCSGKNFLAGMHKSVRKCFKKVYDGILG